ncbi:MAG: ABC transporter ATP-binding protein [Chloroflexi bacterium]|nr:ABC transporter ATP-binding protein [Chloroflexota bacterium]MBI3733387.1 ABC transporter ATP-binding protein [Chloroflexota bacterium]
MADLLVSARDLVVKRGGAGVLDIPSFEIRRGEVISLVGPNGAGKSTLLLALAHLIPIARGEVRFEGKQVGRELTVVDLRRRLAMVFQEPLLLNQSVYDNAAIGLKLHGLPAGEIKARVMPWLEKMGISHLSRRAARTLSGGEAQRASLARALALNPDLLLLDEPFGALDAPTRAALLSDLENILEEMRVTTLFVTHDRMEAYTLGQRIAVMINGRIEQFGEREEVLRAPRSRAVAELMGVSNFLDGVVSGRADGDLIVDWRGMSVRAPQADFPTGARVTLCIRPEEIWIWKPGRPVDPDLQVNQLSGEIVGKRPHGAVDTIFFRAHNLQSGGAKAGYDLELQASYRASQRLGLDVGSQETVALRRDAIHILPRKE